MTINSRSKGGRGEREAVKLLKSWWGSEFSRTPGSGAFATITQRTDLNVSGDVSTPDPDFPFIVEVKWHEDWDLDQLIKSEKCKVWQWWKQAKDQAEGTGKLPLLLMKRNHNPWYYMMRGPGHRGTFRIADIDYSGDLEIGRWLDFNKRYPKEMWIDEED